MLVFKCNFTTSAFYAAIVDNAHGDYIETTAFKYKDIDIHAEKRYCRYTSRTHQSNLFSVLITSEIDLSASSTFTIESQENTYGDNFQFHIRILWLYLLIRFIYFIFLN